MRHRTSFVTAVLVVAAVGCGGSDDSSSGGTSMVGLLDRIPLAALDEAAREGRVTAEIAVGDMDAAAELADLPRPDADDFEASSRWYIDLARPRSIEEGGSGYSFYGTEIPRDFNSVAVVEEVDEELGFSPFDVDAYASFSAVPVEIAVLSGDLTPSDDLTEVGDGIVSAGEGDDFEAVADDRSALRQLGRPHRIAQSDGMVAISLSTPLIEEWLAGGDSLADEPDFAAAAEALDAGGSVAATIVMSPFAAPDLGDDLAASPIDAPFSVVGIGTAEVDEAPGNVIVYVFADADDAADSLPVIEDGWRNGEMASRGAPIAEYVDVVSVEQDDRVVVVTTNVTDISTTDLPVAMLRRGEPIFFHSG